MAIDPRLLIGAPRSGKAEYTRETIRKMVENGSLDKSTAAVMLASLNGFRGQKFVYVSSRGYRSPIQFHAKDDAIDVEARVIEEPKGLLTDDVE